MSSIEKVIKENQEEFMEMVIKFVNEKTVIKRKKSPKTVCHFYALGKTYDNNIFVRNYENFLIDTSKILGYDGFKQVLKSYIRSEEEEFPKSHKGKGPVIKLSNGGVVTGYSGTSKKIEHIKGLCAVMGIKLTMK
jgi:cyclophilin family peptidyl-prolyl cis-trans isomerase